jgi:zeaxanthin glucosyltransferase
MYLSKEFVFFFQKQPMKTVLFITFPYPSHYFPAFDYARVWQNKGYRVIFTVDSEKLQKIVSSEGFESYSLMYAYEYKIKTFNLFLGLLIKSLFDKKFIKIRYREFYFLQIQSKQIKESLNPDIIFLDEHLCCYYPFFKDKNIEINALNPMLSATQKKGIPPLNSAMLATNTYFNRLKCETLWFVHLSKLRFNEFKQQIVFLGKDDIFFLKRICKKNGLNYKDTISQNHSFYRGIKNINTILIAPKVLEYDFAPQSPNETYFTKVITRNESEYITPDYQELIRYIKAQKIVSNLKVICCSFGTLAEFNQKRVNRFIDQVLSKVEDDNILMVVSSKVIEKSDFEKTNFRVFPFLPHLDFLKYVDIMITHGGLGTVKECLQTETPMIIYPILKDIDQPGNAIRIEHKGYGLKGDLDKETPNGFKVKLNILLNRKVIFSHSSEKNQLLDF